MLSTDVIKILVLITLFVATFVFSMLPIKMMKLARQPGVRSRRRKFQCVLSLLSCYSAGVFLSTCLLDLFPDVQDRMFKSLDLYNLPNTYPAAEFVVTVGLFLILIIEQLVVSCKESGWDEQHEPLLYSSTDSITNTGNSRNPNNMRRPVVYHSCDAARPSANHDTLGSGSEERIEEIDEAHTDAEDGTEYEDTVDELTSSQIYQDPNSHSLVRSIILLLALSVHSIFEGIAIGLEESKKDVMKIFLPVAFHKSIIAFSVGMNLVQTALTIPGIIKSNFIFAVSSPVGIGIGIAIQEFAKDKPVTMLTEAILQGFACGTFLYIVFLEILPHEFMSGSRYPHRMLKILLLILGYATVAVVLIFIPSDSPARPVHTCNDTGLY